MKREQRAIQDANPRPVWWEGRDAPVPVEEVTGVLACDLAVVGGGLTGLWTALEALRRNPDRSVVVIEAAHIASGASGRNGGFVSTSLTHGLAHGLATWPDEMDLLVELGEANAKEIDNFVHTEGIDAALRWCGKTLIATRPRELSWLQEIQAVHTRFGQEAHYLNGHELRADVHSPRFLGGLRVKSGGLVDPVSLTLGLRHAVTKRGAVVYENSLVTALRRDGSAVVLTTRHGVVRSQQVVLATNAFRPPLRRLSNYMMPVWDHVLATEPLTPAQLESIGWAENQGLTDCGNQFHYFRRTADQRILWGGYDAVYYFGNGRGAQLEQRESSHLLLAKHFFETFPQLADVKMSNRWAGMIDTTSRFTPMFGTSLNGRVAYAIGFTGLGVGSSRFAAEVALDLLSGTESERAGLAMVRRNPVPFPPEPLRWPVVQATRAALAQEDHTGRRGRWLRLLDRFGVGFAS
ncbi:MAG: NAD(P)/FAD-dependent oxidoreductase [Nocardioides sp.]